MNLMYCAGFPGALYPGGGEGQSEAYAPHLSGGCG